jgi:4-hydroxy-tetrahydrodipicolinate synthase|tara:strand:+ start:872 stop:1840 length:969 start_codon:yes stop_codon:yes gene_type:complete
MNKFKSFDPLWVPIISHYQNTKNLELDNSLIQKHIKWLEPHVKQFLVCGTTGDGWNLTDKLILNWLDILNQKSLINKDNKILFGAFGKTTEDVLRRTDIIEKYILKNGSSAGFFGLTLCAPVNENIKQDEIILHFTRIIENTYLPISIYQLPQVVKCNIEPETLKVLKDKFKDRIQLFKDTSGEDNVVNSGINFSDIIFLRGAEENYFNHLKPNGKYDGFLLSSANCFGKILREICNEVAVNNYDDAEKMSIKLSDLIRISFLEGQKLNFGNPFSNVNKAFTHVLINKDNLNCKTCFDRNIPSDFLNYTFQLLTKYDLAKSL